MIYLIIILVIVFILYNGNIKNKENSKSTDLANQTNSSMQTNHILLEDIDVYLRMFETLKVLEGVQDETVDAIWDMFGIHAIKVVKQKISNIPDKTFYISIVNTSSNEENIDEKNHEFGCFNSEDFLKKCIALKLFFGKVVLNIDTYFESIPNTFFDTLRKNGRYEYSSDKSILDQVSLSSFEFFKRITDYYDSNSNFHQYTKINMIYFDEE